MRIFLACASCLLSLVVACDRGTDSPDPPADAGADSDVSSDTGAATDSDIGSDAAPDAAADSDIGSDAAPDAAADSDIGSDAAADAAADSDIGSDSVSDAMSPDAATTDSDGDGHTPAGGDCDDDNPAVYPGADEVCDGLDNDCEDGIPSDETDTDLDGFLDCEDCVEGTCWQLNGRYSPRDFDVAHDGSVTISGFDATTGELWAECFHPSGANLGSVLIETIDTTAYEAISVTVGRAAETHQSALGWSVRNLDWATDGYDWQTRRAHLDAACELVAGPEALDVGLEGLILRVPRVEISDTGLAGYLYENQSAAQVRLVLFDATGALLSALEVGAEVCGTGGLTQVLGMNRSTGTLIVGCESLSAGAHRYYQRFAPDGTPIDPTPIEVPTASSDRWHDIEVQMNDAGQFVYVSRGEGDRWLATFHTSDGDPLSPIDLSVSTSDKIVVTAAGNFVIGSSGDREVYASDGTYVGATSGAGTIRLDGEDTVYTYVPTEILHDPFPLVD